jgi:ElaB/YqjD/DUF883 family membrane-anchored ribosome-binding protein
MAERDYLTTSTSPYDSPAASGVAFERSSEEIRQNIAATRESITETVDELSSRVQRTFDWKAYVADYPLVATGIAAGVGIMLGFLIRPRTTPAQRVSKAFAEMVEDTAYRFQEQFDGIGIRRPGLGQTLRAAAIASLVQTVGDVARHKLSASQGTNQSETGEEDYTNDADPRHSHRY